MVYHTITIVLGVAAKAKEVLTEENSEEGMLAISRLGRLEPADVDVLISSIHDHNSRGTEEGFIIGVALHVYYRRHNIKCRDCKEFTCCDTCIGQTNNGFYDVSGICDKPTEVNLRHICFACFADNRDDLMAPVKDKIYGKDNKEEKSTPQAKSGRRPPPKLCSTCGCKPDDRFCPETMLQRDYRCEQLKKFLQKYPALKDKEIKLYYLLNDCLCCT